MPDTIAEQYLKEAFKRHVFVCEEGLRSPSGRPHLPDYRHITLAAEYIAANPVTQEITASVLARNITKELRTGITPGAVIAALVGLGYSIEEDGLNAIVRLKFQAKIVKQAKAVGVSKKATRTKKVKAGTDS